jgi:hypothetical protein
MNFKSDRTDIVIREIARLKRQIESDVATPARVRNLLLSRLAVEHDSYLAWLKRYASYFREPVTYSPELAPNPKKRRAAQPSEPDITPADAPRVVVFADFAGFTHRVTSSSGSFNLEEIRHIESLITNEIYDYMYRWTDEFHRYAWDDAMRGQHGTMLWVQFDIQGMSIARAIKRCVGNAARVFYLKPSEDPFAHYDYAREILSKGEIPSPEYPAPPHDDLHLRRAPVNLRPKGSQ